MWMGSLRQTHMSMWMAGNDLRAGKITQAEHEEVVARVRERMRELEREGKSASTRALKQTLMTTAARLTNRTFEAKRDLGSRFPLRKT